MEEELKKLADSYGPEARFRVDLRFGYASYGVHDLDKALALFAQDGIRLLICRDIFDNGKMIAGRCLLNEVARGDC